MMVVEEEVWKEAVQDFGGVFFQVHAVLRLERTSRVEIGDDLGKKEEQEKE